MFYHIQTSTPTTAMSAKEPARPIGPGLALLSGVDVAVNTPVRSAESADEGSPPISVADVADVVALDVVVFDASGHSLDAL